MGDEPETRASGRHYTLQLACLLLAVLVPANVEASTIYRYSGNPFDTIADAPLPGGTYDTSMRIEGFVEFSTALGPGLDRADVTADVLSFSFSDGRQTIDAGVLGSDVGFHFGTDGAGVITDWIVLMRHTPLPKALGDPSGGIFSRSDGSDSAQVGVCIAGDAFSCTSVAADGATIGSAPGTWTLIPEPSTGALLGLGVVALARIRRVH